MSQEGFSAAQIAHYASTTLDYHIRGPLFQQGIQEKPLLAKFENSAKPFPGAKENITIGVKFDRGAGGTNDGVTGFSHTDSVNFYNPTNGLRANYVWREHHIGFTMSETELKQQGILVGDEFGKQIRGRGDRGLIILANIMDEAMTDFTEQYATTMNDLFWDDGTSDTSALHGIRSFIRDVPTIGTVGGLSAATHSRWRNRARTSAFNGHASFDAAHGGDAVTSATSNGGALLTELEKEWRQLRRFGGRPDCFYAGSDFIDALQLEIRANGNYSDSGFTGTQDGSMGDMKWKGMPVVYDPTLDDLSRAKFAYLWDSRDIYLSPLKGDWKRMRTPARPYNKFVFHKSLVCTGQMVSRRRDSALVIEIA